MGVYAGLWIKLIPVINGVITLILRLIGRALS